MTRTSQGETEFPVHLVEELPEVLLHGCPGFFFLRRTAALRQFSNSLFIH
jgi:hypothetical protein